jgi:uncharacterized membrane protein YdjX (TVP38/TMEM64 family)
MAHQIHQLITAAGVAAPLAFVAIEVAMTLLFLPRSVGAVIAGALFGTAAGTLLTWLVMIIGATIAFWIGHRARLAGGRAAHLVTTRTPERIAPWIERLDRWMTRRGRLALLYSRLIPGMPFTSINYAAGATSIRARDFVIATAAGILPGAYLLVALGGSIAHPTSPRFIAIAAAIIALALLAPIVDRTVRQRAGLTAPAEHRLIAQAASPATPSQGPGRGENISLTVAPALLMAMIFPIPRRGAGQLSRSALERRATGRQG